MFLQFLPGIIATLALVMINCIRRYNLSPPYGILYGFLLDPLQHERNCQSGCSKGVKFYGIQPFYKDEHL